MDIIEARAKAREMLPDYMVPGVLRYIEDGTPVGGAQPTLFADEELVGG